MSTAPDPPDYHPHASPELLERIANAPLREVGDEPDPRFTFANERTFLAWNRTALALIAGGIALAEVVKFDVHWLRLVLGLPLIVLGAVLAIASLRNWDLNERCLRMALPLPYPRTPRLLAYGIGVVSVATAIVVIVDAIVGK
jgi:putative membrane protein